MEAGQSNSIAWSLGWEVRDLGEIPTPFPSSIPSAFLISTGVLLYLWVHAAPGDPTLHQGTMMLLPIWLKFYMWAGKGARGTLARGRDRSRCLEVGPGSGMIPHIYMVKQCPKKHCTKPRLSLCSLFLLAIWLACKLNQVAGVQWLLPCGPI